MQIREIGAAQAVEMLWRAGAGAHIARSGATISENITGSPTAGIDPQGKLRPRGQLCAHMHQYILNHREMTACRASSTSPFDGGRARVPPVIRGQPTTSARGPDQGSGG